MAFDPMLFVDDVEASSRWYQGVLGLRGGHGGPHYEMLMDGDQLALQLHHADADEHGGERLPAGSARGAGVLLYFKVDDVIAAYARAQALGARLEGPPSFIELAGHTEFVTRDPDGYAVAVFQRGKAG
jgi:catechol 2,3-dioxygenase-like lactoylglutathione lyase family enzyme